ncbi:hypothetical protein BJ170DRAFT_598888 [Xylariales sp. AK1849]|nr:hypothetical protein BJ170DRAFT_598888 [Xylariales sp. AK1849]
MPMYEVEHITALTDIQKDALALAITDIHSNKFTTPRLFVNVKFTDASKQDTYVAGKRRLSNRIVGRVRRGPTRTQQDFDSLSTDLHIAWSSIIHPSHSSKPPAELELRAVFITGDIIASWKAGFVLPIAGNDPQWVKDNMDAFKEKAREGDQDFVELIEELEDRPGFLA